MEVFCLEEDVCVVGLAGYAGRDEGSSVNVFLDADSCLDSVGCDFQDFFYHLGEVDGVSQVNIETTDSRIGIRTKLKQ